MLNTTNETLERLIRLIPFNGCEVIFEPVASGGLRVSIRYGIDEEPNPRATECARAIVASITDRFKNKVIHSVDYTDEWVDLTFIPKQ